MGPFTIFGVRLELKYLFRSDQECCKARRCETFPNILYPSCIMDNITTEV